MRYRRFGKTGLEIPVISCGCMRFQQSWTDTDPVTGESQRNVEACVHRAIELGIRHFETARGYGTSEYQLGKILPTLKRSDIVVQSKAGPDKDVKKFAANFERSMALLQTDYIDLFAFHGVNDDASLESTLVCMDQALRWKRAGRIRHIGFSTHGPADVILETIRTGAFEYVNLHWYYTFQDNWPAIQEAAKRDMGVMIISPNDKGGMLYSPPAKLMDLCAPLHPMVFNGLFCLAHPEVHTLSCGVARPDDFTLHCETVEKLDHAHEWIDPILERLEDAMMDVFGKEWVETWQRGLPEWHETPGGINIPAILRLRNLARAFDMIEYSRMRYNLLGNGGSWFPGNKAENLERYDLSKCLRYSPHAKKIPAALAEAHTLLVGEEVRRLQEE